MQRYGRNLIAIAVALAALAGFVDAVAFSALGFFASFMSGNSTRLAVALSSGQASYAALAASLLLAFLSGVIVAAILSRMFAARRRVAVLALVTVLLALAAGLAGSIADQLVLLLVAAAMGAENGVFARDGEVSVGVTYMTGALVKLGQKLAAALIGDGGRWDWLPYLALWVGFAAGAIMGAGWFVRLGMGALWIAVVGAAVLTAVVARVGTEEA